MTRTDLCRNRPFNPNRPLGFALIVLGLAWGFSTSAMAAPPKVLETSGDWTAFAEGDAGAKVCYTASAPTKKEGEYSGRGEVAVLVTDNMHDKTRDVVSVVAGYTYKTGDDVLLQVDETKFHMFVHQDRAYSRDSATDKAIVAAMKKGTRMIVVGTSNKGTRTTDSYSLAGFTKTFDAVSKACSEAPEKKAAAKPSKKKKRK
jgi:invasion protein IalB